MNDTEVVVARAVAIEAHQGQVRWGGADYFESHVLPIAQTARRLYGPREESLAFLHDVFEDTRMSPGLVIARGVSSDTVRSALLITRQGAESYRHYIERIMDSGDVPAMRVKLLDLQDNCMTPLPSHVNSDRRATHHQRTDKYELAIAMLSAALAKLPRPE